MTDNLTTPLGAGTKFKTKDFGANGHARSDMLVDSTESEILGTTADAKSTATDTTSVSAMSVWKQISASVQALAGAVSSSKVATKSASGDFADGAIATLGAKADAANTATDTTSVSAISIWKQISASIQTLAGAVSSSKVATKSASGDFADGAIATLGAKADAKSTATDTTSISLMQVSKQISASVQTTASALTDFGAGEYETVAASQTDQALGATGATGDYLSGILIVPATTSPGAVSIKDGAGSAITVFTGGATSVSNLVPFFVPLGLKSGSGAWKVTTGTNVSVIGCGNFT